MTTYLQLRWIVIFLTIVPSLYSISVTAETIRVAIASNFIGVAKVTTKNFELATGNKVILIFGSTGKHAAQIRHGAPYDLFFAADKSRPEILEKEGYTIKGSRFTYALGKLVLWNRSRKGQGNAILFDRKSSLYLAIANPKLAPYGRAARQALTALGVWNLWQAKTVRGENIGQAFQFVRSGNTQLGLVAYSQVVGLKKTGGENFWLVPQNLYSPIEQQAVALNNNPVANSYLQYFKTERVRELIRNHGYDIPK